MTKKSKGLGLGIALGAALGAALGVAAGHVAIWLAVGVAIGLAMGGGFRPKEIDCPECAAVHRDHEAKSFRSTS
jgi:RsiW-degrading membrane proteinase PrsW (M82 family)